MRRPGLSTFQQTQSHQDVPDLKEQRSEFSLRVESEIREARSDQLTMSLRASSFSCSFRLADTCRNREQGLRLLRSAVG